MPAGQPVIETGIDQLLRLLEEHDRISIPQAAKILKLPEEVVEAWAHTLEEDGDVEIEYSLTTPFIIPKRKQGAPAEYTILIQRVREALRKHHYPEAWRALDTLLDILRGMVHDTPTLPEDIKKKLEELNLLLAEKKKPRKRDVEEALHTIETALSYLTQQHEQQAASATPPSTLQSPPSPQTSSPPAGAQSTQQTTLINHLQSLLQAGRLDEALLLFDQLTHESLTRPELADQLSHAEALILQYLTTRENPLTRVNQLIQAGRLDEARTLLNEAARTSSFTPGFITQLISLLTQLENAYANQYREAEAAYQQEEARFQQALQQGDGKTARESLSRLIQLSQHAPLAVRHELINRTLHHAQELAERVQHAEALQRKAWEDQLAQHYQRFTTALEHHLPRQAEDELGILTRLILTPPPGGEETARRMLHKLEQHLPAYAQLITPSMNEQQRIISLLTQAQHAPTLESALSMYEEALRLLASLPPQAAGQRERLVHAFHETLSSILKQHREASACAERLAKARRLISSFHADEALSLLQQACPHPSLTPLYETLLAEARLLHAIQTNKPIPDAQSLLTRLEHSPYTDPTILNYIKHHSPTSKEQTVRASSPRESPLHAQHPHLPQSSHHASPTPTASAPPPSPPTPHAPPTRSQPQATPLPSSSPHTPPPLAQSTSTPPHSSSAKPLTPPSSPSTTPSHAPSTKTLPSSAKPPTPPPSPQTTPSHPQPERTTLHTTTSSKKDREETPHASHSTPLKRDATLTAASPPTPTPDQEGLLKRIRTLQKILQGEDA